MSFSNSLIHWYLQNKRDLPWRNTTDAYTIWLSEIILQQTRVAQGLPYFESFITAFPTVFDLAKASEEQVLKLWQGLGYYSRARNLHATAKSVVDEHNGIFPNSYEKLIKLKGIGEYTAAAIASFSADESVAVLDGNVYRVLARYFNVNNDISVSSTKKVFQELAKEVLPKKNTAIYNQAIMEFGALQCVPKNPNCISCVLADSCEALKHKLVSSLPVKSKKTKVTNRFFTYLVIEDLEGNTSVKHRTEKGIWQNLYEFPVIESETVIDEDEVIGIISERYSKIRNVSMLSSFDVVHKLSHQTLHIRFVKVEIDGLINGAIALDALKKLPFPIVIHNFIERYFS